MLKSKLHNVSVLHFLLLFCINIVHGQTISFFCGNTNSKSSSTTNSTLSIPSPPQNCTSPASIKYIKINAHYMLKSDGTGNFTETNDGYTDSHHTDGVTGKTRAQKIINWANAKMADNYQMFLPAGNSTPVLPKRVQFILDSVYFHKSDTFYNYSCVTCGDQLSTLTDNQYGVNRGYSLNVYFGYDPNSDTNVSGVASIIPEITESPSHLAFKTIGDWQYIYKNFPDWDGAAQNLCHEIEHLFGLYHDWNVDDGCDDTPFNNNCYDLNNPTGTLCDDYSKVTNNNMSYSNGYHTVLTPCQIGRIHDRLERGLANYVDHCTINCSVIPSSLTLNSYSPLNLYAASTSIISTALVDIAKAVDGDNKFIYKSPSIILNPGFKVVLGTSFMTMNYACSSTQGLMAQPQNNKNSSFLKTEQYSDQTLIDESANSNFENTLKVFPSPTKSEVNIKYSIAGETTPIISILNTTGEVVQTIKTSQKQSKGVYQVSINSGRFSEGIYIVIFETEACRLVEKFVVQK